MLHRNCHKIHSIFTTFEHHFYKDEYSLCLSDIWLLISELSVELMVWFILLSGLFFKECERFNNLIYLRSLQVHRTMIW